jgi:hypothetical protein
LPAGELGINGIAMLDGEITPLITLRDGQPLLAELVRDRGRVFLLACPPIEPYSNIARNGVVLYAAMRRSMTMSYDRRASTRSIVARRWRNNDTKQLLGTFQEVGSSMAGLNVPPPSTWQPLTSDKDFLSTETGFHAGVFQADEQLLAINRPTTEDELASVDDPAIAKIFDGIEVTKITDQVGLRRDVQQEVWRFFLMAMIVALIMEAWLSLPRSSSHRITPANQTKDWASR